MQTFVPVFDVEQIAKILDRRRLWKQAVETKQIWNALTIPGYAYTSHPATLMWSGHKSFLIYYGLEMATESLARGIDCRNLQDWFFELLDPTNLVPPPWWGDERVASSHRAALLFKKPEHYSKFHWTETPVQDYFWPRPAAVELLPQKETIL